MRTVFDAILECGHDEDFVPQRTPDFKPTDAPAGSLAKLKVLADVFFRVTDGKAQIQRRQMRLRAHTADSRRAAVADQPRPFEPGKAKQRQYASGNTQKRQAVRPALPLQIL